MTTYSYNTANGKQTLVASICSYITRDGCDTCPFYATKTDRCMLDQFRSMANQIRDVAYKESDKLNKTYFVYAHDTTEPGKISRVIIADKFSTRDEARAFINYLHHSEHGRLYPLCIGTYSSDKGYRYE